MKTNKYGVSDKDTRPVYQSFEPGTFVAGRIRCTYVIFYSVEGKPICTLRRKSIGEIIIGYTETITVKNKELVSLSLTDEAFTFANSITKSKNDALKHNVVYVRPNALFYEKVENETIRPVAIPKKKKNLLLAALALAAVGLN